MPFLQRIACESFPPGPPAVPDFSARKACRLAPLSGGERAAVEALYEKSVRANPRGFIQDLSHHGPIFELLSGFVASGGAAEVMRCAAEGPVVGMGALRPMAPGVMELCKLHLDAAFHGRGLGRRLAGRLLARARALECRRLELHVTTTQRAAIALYRGLGFVDGKTRPCPVVVAGETVVFETLFMSLAMRADGVWRSRM